MKRLFDIAFAGLLVVMASPVLLLAAAAVGLTSPGGVIYRAKRAGKDGQPFTMYKFRTMVSGADRGAKVTLKGDSRITGIGRLLRMTKLDEFPQLFNVLKGEMSFVGPRPEDPALVDRYYTPRMRESLRYLPGLTSPGSLAYVEGLGDNLPDTDDMDVYAEKVLGPKLEHDLAYFTRQSVAGDIGILLRTVWVVGKAVLMGRSQ